MFSLMATDVPCCTRFFTSTDSKTFPWTSSRSSARLDHCESFLPCIFYCFFFFVVVVRHWCSSLSLGIHPPPPPPPLFLSLWRFLSCGAFVAVACIACVFVARSCCCRFDFLLTMQDSLLQTAVHLCGCHLSMHATLILPLFICFLSASCDCALC